MASPKTLDEVIESLTPKQRATFASLRDRILALGEVKEQVTRHEDAPTYSFMGKQLLHVHPGERSIGVTVPLATSGLVPRLLEDPGLRAKERQAIKKARDYRGYRWVFFSLEDADDVEAVVRIITTKVNFIAGRGKPRVTLESFGAT